MPTYIIERDMGSVDLADVPGFGKASNAVLDNMEGVVWIRSYISESAGKVFCEYSAPNPEALQRHAELLGIPATNICEIAMEVEPSMFR